MKKKKTNKGAVRRLSLLFIIFLCVLVYTGYVTFVYWGKIIDKYQEKKELELKYANLIDEEELLEKEVNKLVYLDLPYTYLNTNVEVFVNQNACGYDILKDISTDRSIMTEVYNILRSRE